MDDAFIESEVEGSNSITLKMYNSIEQVRSIKNCDQFFEFTPNQYEIEFEWKPDYEEHSNKKLRKKINPSLTSNSNKSINNIKFKVIS